MKKPSKTKTGIKIMLRCSTMSIGVPWTRYGRLSIDMLKIRTVRTRTQTFSYNPKWTKNGWSDYPGVTWLKEKNER